MRALSRGMRALRRAAQRGDDEVWADPDPALLEDLLSTTAKALPARTLAPSPPPMPSPPAPSPSATPVEEPYVLELLSDDDDAVPDIAVRGASPNKSRERGTVLVPCDIAFMERLVAARRGVQSMEKATWGALVAALGGAHPRVATMQSAIHRVTFLTKVLADPTHREHSKLPRRLRELLATYARLRAVNRVAAGRSGGTPPKNKTTTSAKDNNNKINKTQTTASARSPAGVATTTTATPTTPTPRTPALESAVTQLVELLRSEHGATLRAIERADERLHASVARLLATAERVGDA